MNIIMKKRKLSGIIDRINQNGKQNHDRIQGIIIKVKFESNAYMQSIEID